MASNQVYITPDALEVPYDPDYNSESTLTSETTQEAIDELEERVAVSASPGFTWGKGGNTTSGTWLLNDNVPSNKAGRIVFLSSATLEKIYFTSRQSSTFDLEVYEHDGTSYTLVYTANVVASRSATFDASSTSLTTGKELAIKVANGSVKNPVVGVLIKGSL